MNELEKTALNEILRTVTYIAKKVDEIDSKISSGGSEMTKEEKEKMLDSITNALSEGKGIVEHGLGSRGGHLGHRAVDRSSFSGIPGVQ